MSQKVIHSTHVYILLIMSTGFLVHVLLHPIILTVSKRDSWISVIGSVVPFILWTAMIYYLNKKFEKKNILSVLFSLHPMISYLIRIIWGVYFFLTAFITFQYTDFWAKSNYTSDIPDFLVVVPFAALCYFASLKGIRTIGSLSIFLLPLVVMFGLLVGIGNIKNKDYSLLFPVFEHGYKDFFLGVMYTCACVFEIIYFLFITPYIEDRIKIKPLLLVCIGLVFLAVGPLAGGIAEFGAEEAAKMKVPAYEEWKLLTIGVHITRLDFLSIFQWLSGAFIRISLNMFIVNKLLDSHKKKNWILLFLYILLITSVLIPWDFSSFFTLLYSVYYPVSLVFLLLLVGLLFFLKKDKGDAI
ncbi:MULTISPECIES: endospore germination permease [Bacillaceae]|uniref:endospore germination permease n=1 Tax=Bacillaceae TaxID=186817 RepID=UPI00088E3456|nr:endospore germination permease [Bacillus sp. OK048]SDN90873.1 spore germination protein (amino acid permease) [Bacillus sp. OK048]